MSKPSVEEIVAMLEAACVRPDPNVASSHLRLLIADWRKRGEALEEIRDADQVEMALDPDWPSRVARAALTPHPPT